MREIYALVIFQQQELVSLARSHLVGPAYIAWSLFGLGRAGAGGPYLRGTWEFS